MPDFRFHRGLPYPECRRVRCTAPKSRSPEFQLLPRIEAGQHPLSRGGLCVPSSPFLPFLPEEMIHSPGVRLRQWRYLPRTTPSSRTCAGLSRSSCRSTCDALGKTSIVRKVEPKICDMCQRNVKELSLVYFSGHLIETSVGQREPSPSQSASPFLKQPDPYAFIVRSCLAALCGIEHFFVRP